MLTVEIVAAHKVPHVIPVFYPGQSVSWGNRDAYPFGATGQGDPFGAIRRRPSRRIPARVRRRVSGRARSYLRRSTPARPARRQYSRRRADPAAAARGRADAARRRSEAAARRASSGGWREAYYHRTGRQPPAGMRRRIERANIAVARRKAAAAARKKADEERRARVAVHPQRPAANAGIREWEAYYKATGTRLAPGQRRKIEQREKNAFFRATGANFFVTSDFMKTARVGRRRGVAWMFSVAYFGRTMPYWNLWYDKKKTAKEIAAMVAADYMKEIKRRVALGDKYRVELEAWQDAGRPGARPRIDPREGLHSPITAPRTYA